uniref:Mitogen-activated protein kinase kinase kinase n=1 Tax=Panagrolaimus sp. PS1159 TaxID=55785 RepID=A0AC35FR21_9BILA
MNPLSLDVSPGPSEDNGYFSHGQQHQHHYTRQPSRQTSHDSYNSSDNNESTVATNLSQAKYKIVGEQDIEFPAFNATTHLGHGTYGTVIQVKYKNQKAALKILSSDVTFKAVNIEADLLHNVQHENIILLYAVYKSDQQTGLLLELMPGGSLHQLLHKHQQVRYYADHAIGWAYQCVSALAYLHKQGFLHRDLKPSNMLLSDNFMDLKLCDFGTAAKLRTIMTNNCGSAAYMAPEVFKQSKYDQKCDMYSFGISLWEIIARRYPVDANETNNYRVLWQTTMENKRPPQCTKIPKPLKDIIEQCWHQEPSARPEAKEILDCLQIIMEFYGNRFKPLIDLTTNKQAFASTLHERPHQAFASTLHERPHVSLSSPADLDKAAKEVEALSPRVITPSAPFPSAPFADYENENNKPRRIAPPVPPRPSADSLTGHRRNRSQDFNHCAPIHTRYPSGNSSQSTSVNLLPTPPPYGLPSTHSPHSPQPPSSMPYSPCLTNATSPCIPQIPTQNSHPFNIGFNQPSNIQGLPPPPYIQQQQPTHLVAPADPAIGWNLPRRSSEGPPSTSTSDFGCGLGNGYVSNDSNKTS